MKKPGIKDVLIVLLIMGAISAFFFIKGDKDMGTAFVIIGAISVVVFGYNALTERSSDKKLDKRLNDMASSDSDDEYGRRSDEYAAKHPAERAKSPDMLSDLRKKYRTPLSYVLGVVDVLFLLVVIVILYPETGFSLTFIFALAIVIGLGYYVYYRLTAVPVTKLLNTIPAETMNELNEDYMSARIFSYKSSGICVGNKYVFLYSGAGVTIVPAADIAYAGKYVKQIKHYTNGIYTGSEYHYIVRIITNSPTQLTSTKPESELYPEFHKYGLHQVLDALAEKGVPVSYDMNVGEE